MKTIRTSVYKLAAVAALSATLMIGGAMSASAKPNGDTSAPRGEGHRGEGHRRDGHRRGGHRRGGVNVQRLATKLNLSEAQKTQIQAIMQRSRADAQAVKSNTSLSQEQKRAQLKTIHKNAREAITNVLTPAQRTQLAQMKSERKGERGGRGAKLNLTEAQKSQIQAIRSAAKADIQAVKANTGLSREAKRAQLQVIHTNTRDAISNILTPAQRQQLEERKAERRGKRAERKANRKANRNNGLNN